jgi:hypothetical protein
MSLTTFPVAHIFSGLSRRLTAEVLLQNRGKIFFEKKTGNDVITAEKT